MTSTSIETYAVLLAGGSGSRLWPVSRQLYPKQLVKFTGNYSLLQNTVKRLEGFVAPEKVRIVCGQEHLAETARHMAELGLVNPESIICEPCGRNTAPAILLAALKIRKIVDDAVLLVFPADHVVKDLVRFRSVLQAAIRLAQQGHIVTFGIEPDYPETGYGYIEGGEEVSNGALQVKRFVEKPDLTTAETYLAAGNFFWNSGMFAFRASVLLEEFKTHANDLFLTMNAILADGRDFTANEYERLPNISIDYAIMEKTDKIVVLPSGFGWSDIGTWKALYDFLPKDHDHNVLDGDVVAHDTRNCFIMGRERLIAANAVENMVLVETPDAVFVSAIDKSRDVKAIVEQLKQKGRSEYRKHNTIYHAWGSTTLLEEQAAYRVRRLLIYPEATLTITVQAGQKKKIDIVQGIAAVTQDGQAETCPQTAGFDILPEHSADVTNEQTEPLYMIEITVGEYKS